MAREGEIRYWQTHDLRDRTIRQCRRGIELSRGGHLNLLRRSRRHSRVRRCRLPIGPPSNRHASAVWTDARVRDRWR
jgi:hypothetical protein